MTRERLIQILSRLKDGIPADEWSRLWYQIYEGLGSQAAAFVELDDVEYIWSKKAVLHIQNVEELADHMMSVKVSS